MQSCKHKKGDTIQGMWVCADCFRPLDVRPIRYRMTPYGRGRDTRQEISWMAEVAKDNKDTTFGKFVSWMVSHLRLRSLWTISKENARRQCLDLLQMQGEPYGSTEFDWDKSAAKELVDEGIVSYWDEAPSSTNF